MIFLKKEYDDFEDETLGERLWALTEMFPEPVRNASDVLFNKSIDLSKNFYKLSRAGIWVAASSFTVLILPIICEQERSNLEEMQAMQQRELLLGPSAASSASQGAGAGLGMPFMPPIGK